MRSQHSVSDIISSHVQASLSPNKLQVRCDYVPERVRHETTFTAAYQSTLSCTPESPTSSKSASTTSDHLQRLILLLLGSNRGGVGWDGFLRVCFIRKNKTLGSIFRQKSVLLMLEKNFKTLQAVLASVDGSTGAAGGMDLGDQSSMGMEDDDNEMHDDDDDDDVEMDEGQGGEKVMNVLKEGGFEEKRSSKLSQQEFLYLLSLFNKSGIHFS